MLTDKLIINELINKNINNLYISYSGGIDSHVLLHLIASSDVLRNSYTIKAIHVDHGLQAQSKQWAEHCQAVCQEYAMACELISLNCQPPVGVSVQAYAREQRYQAIFQQMPQQSCLLTAHHQDDQAETLLLQLMRGSGVQGLAAMPVWQCRHANTLFRPFVNKVTRHSILEYAQSHQLQWIDDPSNDKMYYDRNYLRQAVMPALTQHWPSLSKTLARSARLCAETSSLLSEIAEQDIAMCLDNDGGLKLDSLKKLSQARQKNSLRFWLQQQGLLLPSEVLMQQMHQQLLNSREDAEPVINHHDRQLRRYHNTLYCMTKLTDATMPVIPWDLSQSLDLPENLGRLSAELSMEQGIFVEDKHSVSVRFRQGGERCQPVGRVGSHPLKKLMQEWNIPPWKRDKIPLIFVYEEIAQIVDYCICQPFSAKKNQKNYIIKLNKE